MKKSLLALVLALIMCLSLFCTSCSSGGDDENPDVMDTDSETKAITLTLYAPTKGTTTQEQIDIVQEAFNNITQAKFNTNVILKLIPEDKYADTIQNTINSINQQIAEEEAAAQSRFEAEKEAMLKGETLPPEETEAPATNAGSDADSPEITYPAERENQLDIFLVQSFETYYELVMNQELAPLDEEIAEGSKLLNSYIYPYLLRSAVIDGSIYGVFNNTIFGDYQYMLLNKELVDKYNYDPEEMTTFTDITMFLQEVKANEEGVIPFLGNPEPPVTYWNDKVSLVGAYCENDFTSSGHIDATSFVPEALSPSNLLNSTGYRAWLKAYNELYRANCLVEKTEGNANSKFAATIINGDVTLSPTYAEEYGKYKVDEFGFKYITDENGVDYYVSVYKRPVADNKNVFNAGYVISTHTEDVARCMEILTCLNTDATLSNILMYGVEGVHYTVDEDTKVVHKTTDTYAMDITTIGNIYLLKESDDMNDYWKFMSKNGWQNAKNTNREAVMSPYLGFMHKPEKPVAEDLEEGVIFIDLTFDEVIQRIEEISPDIINSIMKFEQTDGLDFDTFLTILRSNLNDNDYITAIEDMYKGMYYTKEPYGEWHSSHYGS